jgi:hypothetical protein
VGHRADLGPFFPDTALLAPAASPLSAQP